MPVPLLDVNAQNLPLESEFKAAFERVLHSGRFIMGPEVEEFEAAVAQRLGVKHALGVSSGTDALVLALMALGIGPGDEVLCPSFTFFATAGSVARVGATPIFVDCCPVCFNLDLSSAHAALSARTKAIIPVHLFGQSADMDSILSFAQEHGLKVIEDAAQSLGARYRGVACGAMGDFGTYSFFPSKNLGGFGDSGMLVTQNDELAERAIKLRNHGMHPRYYHQMVGGNFRMDPLQAAMLAIKLKHYDEYTAQRQRNAEDYTKALLSVPGVVLAQEKDCCCIEKQTRELEEAGVKLVLPVAYAHNEHIWNQFTLRVLGGHRDALKAHLTEHGIGCEVYYPVPMHRQECFTDVPSRVNFPVTECLQNEVLSLPIYPELSFNQKAEVVAVISDFICPLFTES